MRQQYAQQTNGRHLIVIEMIAANAGVRQICSFHIYSNDSSVCCSSSRAIQTIPIASANPSVGSLPVTKVQHFYCGHYSIKWMSLVNITTIGTSVRLYLNSIVFKTDYLSTIEYIVWYVICRDGRT